MKHPEWDKYETALLIDTYWRIKSNPSQKKALVLELSASLRSCSPSEIDETYRNENGINMRLGELDYLFSSGEYGLKKTSNLFRDMVQMYLNKNDEYQIVLSEAKKRYYNSNLVLDTFRDWIQKKDVKLHFHSIRDLLFMTESYCIKTGVLSNPLFKTTNPDTIKNVVDTVSKNIIFRLRFKRYFPGILDAINWYYSFILVMPNLIQGASKNEPDFSASTKPVQLSPEDNASDIKNEDCILDKFISEFSKWLLDQAGISSDKVDSYLSILKKAEDYAQDHKLGPEPYIICTLDASNSMAVISALIQNEQFKKYNVECDFSFIHAFELVIEFFKYIVDNEKSLKPHSDIEKEIAALLRNSPEGISKAALCEHFPDCSSRQFNRALESCDPVIVLGKYYHKDCISDYQVMADILLGVLLKQFSQNSGYTSALQLYNEARPKLDDFFFYNNAFDSRQEVYDLALHLFERERYKGYSFIFINNMHIWKEEPDYPKDFHGLLIKYAREHGNLFSREEALSYFEKIGSATSAATFSNVIFRTGANSFLQYAENQFVLTEAIQFNDSFLSSVSAQIENLLEGEDYIAIGEIDDYFYTTLPALPSGIFWSALLLEDVLRIFETGFTTIEAGKDNDKKTVPAAIVRKESQYRSFSDVVWNEVSKSFSLPKEFTASEFREFLLDKGFIRGSEKMWNVHKTVAGDIRFYWIDNNGRVIIN